MAEQLPLRAAPYATQRIEGNQEQPEAGCEEYGEERSPAKGPLVTDDAATGFTVGHDHGLRLRRASNHDHQRAEPSLNLKFCK